ncbi:SAM-dependent methyltransferase [Actinocorallia herbida]|nr:SAM-dependent methyltransferase [Actinocorallia herbida]
MSDDSTTDRDAGREEIDTTLAHSARMYDYYLGGKDNYQADRDAAEKMIEATRGGVRFGARQNRAFLLRAVRYLAAQGVTQFLDIGTGIPTSPNTHDAAREVVKDPHVVYVDNDPIVFVHSSALLGAEGRTAALRADLREPATVLEHPRTRDLIDFGKPVGVLFIAVLQFLEDADDPWAHVATYLDAVPSGSHLALTHFTHDFNPVGAAQGGKAYDKASARMSARGRAEVGRFFTGLDLVDPGVVQASRWRPDGPVADVPGGHPWMWAAVGRKP